jgi:hypothetical protein
MSQADSPNTTSPSRRAVLAGISVAVVPIVAAVEKSLAHHEPFDHDAKLLALGARLDALLPELQANRQAELVAVDAADEEASRRVGFDICAKDLSGQQAAQGWATLKLVRDELGTNDAIRACDEAWGRADRLQEEISAAPAHTLVGFAVKARAAAALTVSDLWDQPAKDMDWHDWIIRDLIEGICSAAGMPLADPRIVA